jgi:Eukaryotic protein of unknown function (DUF842)
MASPAAQAQAQALNAKLEAQARIAIDEIERSQMRKIARSSHVCATACYDKAGTSGPADALEACVHNCQMPAQQANAYVQSVRILCARACVDYTKQSLSIVLVMSSMRCG